VISLPVLGVEHLLLGFRIPAVLWSDMNGFGHFALQTWSLMLYWGAFCALLLVLALLLYPRGQLPAWRERLQTLHTRFTPPVQRAAAVALTVLLLSGSFIFYNTNVLNDYVPSQQAFDAQARYEREYGHWRTAALPSFIDPDLQVELYPQARRVDVRGTAQLRNEKAGALTEFPLTVFRGNEVLELQVDGASLIASDAALGFYLFRPDTPLAPGASLALRWSFTRRNPGFPNGAHDTEIVGNGSYVRSGLAPLPGYCRDCELESNAERARRGLPPRSGLPALGDPAWLDVMVPGLDTRSSFHAVIGTDADQSVVASGMLYRSWEADGRRYFEYGHPGPIWPLVAPLSGRYTVARDQWNGVPIEIHHHPEHAWNISAMMASIKLGMDYYSRAFAPYSLPFFRITEYARYSTRVQAGVGSVAYAEGSGFTTDLRGTIDLDYATLHELAHQWWGNDVYGAHMQGQQVLNEGLAQYSTFMALRAAGETAFLHEVLRSTHDSFLAGRKGDAKGENPVIKSDDQAHIAYGKAPLALFALQELIGEDAVNAALARYHARFKAMRPPLPTTLDLVYELRQVASAEQQQLITDLFEKITLYDVGVVSANVVPDGDSYRVTLDLEAHQYEADAAGNEREVPLDTWFQVALFPAEAGEQDAEAPLYLQHLRLRSGRQQVVIELDTVPATVAVDPWYTMLDRLRDNNRLELAAPAP
jgi:ABC-2 type transport system permease protein